MLPKTVLGGRAVPTLPGQVVLLKPPEVYRRLAEWGDEVVLLDVRTPPEKMIDGYIEGALQIPTYELVSRVQKEIPLDKPVVVYCAHGIRSASVASYLHKLGYRQVYDMAGGITAWRQEQLPILEEGH